MDCGPRGLTGHNGSDKSTPSLRMNFYGEWEVTVGENVAYSNHMGIHAIAQLIVDDGVPSRGHRANVYGDEYKVVGVAVGPHADFEKMCVMDFAGAFCEDSEEKQKEVHKRRAKKLFLNVEFTKKPVIKKVVSPTQSKSRMVKSRNVMNQIASEYCDLE